MFTAIESALYTALLTDPEIATMFGSRIYTLQAPSGITLPFIVLRHDLGGYMNDNPRSGIDVVYEVACTGATREDAADGADLIEAVLHHQPLTITGWTHMDTTGSNWFSEVINVGGEQFYRAGASYRIRASGV